MFDTLTQSFKNALGKIRFQDDLKALEKALDELKKALLRNDVHHKVARELVKNIEAKTKAKGIGKQQFLDALQESLLEILSVPGAASGFVYAPTPPTIVLMCGLQGGGKTTTCAKLANYLKTRNKKVLLVACDLERLAAIEQLQVLGAQIGVEVFHKAGSVLDIAKGALERAKEGQFDVVLVDSAGRLAIDKPLMDELKALKDLLKPLETFYVADALSGQDGVRSAQTFHTEIGISGVVLSKFDSDSKGGVALGIAHQLQIPLRFIGHGEKIPDLDIFVPERIANRLMGAGDIVSLVEKTSSVIDPKEAKNISKKLKKGQFGFTDFLEQLEKVKKLGSISSLVSMIPGLSGVAGALKGTDLENSAEIKRIKAMVNSMTAKERDNPSLLNGSRKKRIALGSGLEVAEINRILKRFDQASQLAKKLSSKGGVANLLQMLQQNQPPQRH
ncbi:signal recognition particle protein [Helicobacter ailurogastricus]|uniref:signal-recognition-particle GTPase n=1 Tax=Helicobacter ailurogastricus TaxID=1578720 RepID=A0A0K2Y5X2_9HELI|nr:signal recognition particle protein [Helicobacter ailurogastricus]BDQ28856.1 signal recognition particle protein [Helicobacter ailurogastricus]GLH57929.1 Signal recognition particle protein [Helicobacter ailurogastricus]GLH59450.1 Signal recognition particle protein [Helicobacter ailurogastricus]CRI32377.1 Signal recognition particle, subunit Ffh SRP54 (TC 3.A.5.1.1) [Helicobacter ailurogastricus]